MVPNDSECLKTKNMQIVLMSKTNITFKLRIFRKLRELDNSSDGIAKKNL